MEGWRDGGMDGWRDGWMDGGMDGWMDGAMEGWMEGWVDGWRDGFVWILRTKNTFPMSTCVTKHRCVDQSDTSQLEEELMSLLYSAQ